MTAEVKREKFEDVVLLDLKMKDEAMSQRRQVVSRDRKRPGTRSSPMVFRKNAALPML